MSQSLFVYGSLMAPEVMQAVIGRLPPSCPATLAGYVRHPVRNQVYPGLVSCNERVGESNDSEQCSSSSSTLGVLYTDLNSHEMDKLDWFESTDYTRTAVSVTLPNEGFTQPTQVYVFTNPIDQLDTSRDWSLEDFRKHHLEQFLGRSAND
ncbi:hypothetical protein MPSEU_000586900 [Mayamaea pseudoterrestris]|nr:hypothetical protein MPSEU_000586900 [Mayamaea pseudoterrestris]